jgi:hypothetical protein
MKKHIWLALIFLPTLSLYAAPESETKFFYDNSKMSLKKNQKPSLTDIKKLLKEKAPKMRKGVLDKVLLGIHCAHQKNAYYKQVLAIIDYSLPANEKRFWVIDLKKKALLFNTYVSHGIKSGELRSSFFSNRSNSKASSIGVFKTLFSYYGRHGYALRLSGLENNYNSNAQRRAIVMHGSWYVNEKFIKKYGRPGRSWGCPAIPKEKTNGIINSIKDDALFIAYYPNDDWFIDSKYLNCEGYSHFAKKETLREIDVKPSEVRKDIIYVERNDNERREENEPILIISADTYLDFFKKPPPLKRMLRRKIKNIEYIALTPDELKILIKEKPEYIYPEHDKYTKELLFVIPKVRRIRGYYATEMEELPLGKINAISEGVALNKKGERSQIYTMEIQNKKPLELKSTSQFIRWLGM